MKTSAGALVASSFNPNCSRIAVNRSGAAVPVVGGRRRGSGPSQSGELELVGHPVQLEVVPSRDARLADYRTVEHRALHHPAKSPLVALVAGSTAKPGKNRPGSPF